ncbi:MAG TPA: HAD-IC family P-type ATPase, partial [Candidatus Lokiarchaeia archaeon]
VFGNIGDAITIFAIITVLVFVEIFNEYRAKKTIASLKQLAELTTPVIREGTYQEIKPIDLVPGDIILLKMGQKVPADARLLDSYGLQIDESMLTGESVPILKNADIILTETEELMERKNMIFTGTTITRGKGKAVVVSTGINTELGKIAGITQAIKEPKTPLQLAMKQLSKWLVFVAIFFCILIPIIGILQRRDLIQMILIGLSLSFATIPEELPIIITIVLALGAFTLSRKKALVKNLNTAETLGCVTVIATDKTGTLTENKMKLTKIYSDEAISDINSIEISLNARFLLEIGTLVNDIIIKKINEDVSYIGDPMEIAIIEAAELNEISFTSLNKEYVLKNEYSFDNQRMMMSQIYSKNNELFLFSKGAAENVLNRSSRIKIDNVIKDLNQENKQEIINSVEKITAEGLRVIAFAYNDLSIADLPQEDAEKNLIFVGLAAFFDPPRKEVKDAILASKKAGIRIIMITGDYETTAKNIAKTVGIDAVKAITGRELENMTDEKLKEVVKNVS